MAQQPFHQTRRFYALIAVVILALFYLAGPFSASTSPNPHTASANARLARWMDNVTPDEAYQPVAHAYEPPTQQPISSGGSKIKLYPLGQKEQKDKPRKRSVSGRRRVGDMK